jgi:hypothetical protein
VKSTENSRKGADVCTFIRRYPLAELDTVAEIKTSANA